MLDEKLIKSLKPEKNRLNIFMIIWSVSLLTVDNLLIILSGINLELIISILICMIPCDLLFLFTASFMYKNIYEPEINEEIFSDKKYIEYIYTFNTALLMNLIPFYQIEIFLFMAILSLVIGSYYFRKLLKIRVGILFLSETRDEDYSPLWGVSKNGIYMSLLLVILSIVLLNIEHMFIVYDMLIVLNGIIFIIYVLLIMSFLKIITLRKAYKRISLIDKVMVTHWSIFKEKIKMDESSK